MKCWGKEIRGTDTARLQGPTWSLSLQQVHFLSDSLMKVVLCIWVHVCSSCCEALVGYPSIRTFLHACDSDDAHDPRHAMLFCFLRIPPDALNIRTTIIWRNVTACICRSSLPIVLESSCTPPVTAGMLCHATSLRCQRVGEGCHRHFCLAQTTLKASSTACPALRRASSRPVISTALWLSLELVPLQLLIQGSALADESAPYNVGAQSEFLQTLVGILWLALVAYFFYRVFTGRASRFISGVRILRFCVGSISWWQFCGTDGC